MSRLLALFVTFPTRTAFTGYETELAWAAGFFDGEGHVGVHRDKRPGRNLKLQIGIEQADKRPLERFKEAVEWSGTVARRTAPRTPNRRQMYRIIMGHNDTVLTMRRLWPYLSLPKREQLLRALEQLGDSPHAFA